MVLTFLSDFTKRTTDLWKSKKFSFNKTLEVNVDSKNSISFSGKHVLKEKSAPSTEVTLKQKEDGLGELELVLKSSDDVKFTLKSGDLADKLDVELVVGGADTGELKATYGDDRWAGNMKARAAGSNLTVDGQFSFAYENVTLGAQGILDTADGTLTEANVGVRLDQDAQRTYSLVSSDKFNEVAVAFYYQINKDAEVGTQVDIDMGKGKIGIQAGGSYKLDGNSKLRYNLNSRGMLGLAYEYRFNDRVQGFVGTKYNLSDNAVAENFGYKLDR
eukprot:UN32154